MIVEHGDTASERNICRYLFEQHEQLFQISISVTRRVKEQGHHIKKEDVQRQGCSKTLPSLLGQHRIRLSSNQLGIK